MYSRLVTLLNRKSHATNHKPDSDIELSDQACQNITLLVLKLSCKSDFVSCMTNST